MTTDPEIDGYFEEVAKIAALIDRERMSRMVDILAELKREGGRLFCLGVGGSAANASHAVCDFRKLCGFEAYSPSDNIAELTARTNDDGWSTIYAAWLAGSRLGRSDVVLVLSVGGGSETPPISPNIVRALDYARQIGAKILGIVGRDGGHTARLADACVVVPTVNPARVTPHAEAFQAAIWHALATHSRLAVTRPKWESV